MLPTIKPDAVLLDLMLPDGDGLDLLKSIRVHTNAPVIIISGKGRPSDKIAGLERGADDYIVKPLQMQELAARVKAQIRRYRSSAADQSSGNSVGPVRIRFGEWVLDRKQFQVFSTGGASAELTIKEFRLLEALVLSPDSVLSREQILDYARTGEYDISDRAVDVQIMRIRKKLRDAADEPAIIRAVRGVGYALAPKTEVLS